MSGAVQAVVEAERAARRDAEAHADRIVRLQAATAALSGARTPDDVAEVTLGAGLAALGGARGFVLVPGAETDLAMLRCAGMTEEAARLAAASGAPNPAADAFRTAAPVFLEDPGALAARYPHLAGGAEEKTGEAVAALPLAFEGRALGVLVVGFEGPRRFEEADRAAAVALAGQCAQALERARLFVAERHARAEAVAARRRLAFLDELSAHLAEIPAQAEMLAGVARLCVRALGDWAGVFTAREGEEPVLVAQAGSAALGQSTEARLRADPAGRLGATCRGGDPVLAAGLPPLRDPVSPPPVALAPLRVKGRALGALAVASADPARHAGPSDLALAADVAHRTALALEHARLLEEATAAARAREEFLHVASHELRGPIGTLRLTVQLLARDVQKGRAASVEARLRAVERQAHRLTRLSDALLDVSRITAGRLELSPEEGDLAALAREVARRVEEEAGEDVPPLSVEAPAPVRCSFDPARMDQVLSNLLSNAMKYGRGEPVRVIARALDGRAVLEVEDHGIGIAPEHQERIFDRFERAVSGRHYGGLGLGLWIVRRLVEAHGGTIRVRSTTGEGSTFTIELPVEPDAR